MVQREWFWVTWYSCQNCHDHVKIGVTSLLDHFWSQFWTNFQIWPTKSKLGTCSSISTHQLCLHASNGAFPLPDSDSYSDYCTDSDSMQKCSTGTNSDGDSYAKSQWKLVKFHLIVTDIGTKMGTVAMGIGTCIGIGIGSLETFLHIIIIAIFIGIGIGVGQWKRTIR